MTPHWMLLLLTDLLIPLLMVIFGLAFRRNIPGKVNALFGYRTPMSMKNPQTWSFAHRHCGALWFRLGLVLLPLSPIPLLLTDPREPESVALVGLAVCCGQLLPLLLPLYFTERALKRAFHPDGTPKAPPVSSPEP